MTEIILGNTSYDLMLHDMKGHWNFEVILRTSEPKWKHDAIMVKIEEIRGILRSSGNSPNSNTTGDKNE